MKPNPTARGFKRGKAFARVASQIFDALLRELDTAQRIGGTSREFGPRAPGASCTDVKDCRPKPFARRVDGARVGAIERQIKRCLCACKRIEGGFAHASRAGRSNASIASANRSESTV